MSNLEPQNGSTWRKWDLHIHSPYSINQYYPNTPNGWEKFINALENLPREVAVIGITDYYFIDGYKKVMEYKNSGRLMNLEKIFPILEFRIDTFGSGNENKLQKINLHILFDIDESDLSEDIKRVEDEFIKQIPISSLEKHKTKHLSKKNLTEEGGNNLATGFESFIPPTKRVLELIDSSRWRNKTFLFLGYKEWSNLEKNQQLKPLKEDLYTKVGAFFTNNSVTIEKNQGWLNEFGSKKLLHSLDIHGFDLLDTYEHDQNGELKSPVKYHCNTWIKANPTFQGLKQLKFEPDMRVAIQKNKPHYKAPIDYISKVQFISSEEGKIRTNPIHLNPDLNVIIGGKSSGKSLLLYNIASTIDPGQTQERLLRGIKDDDEIQRIKSNDKYEFKAVDANYNFKVTYGSGSKMLLHPKETQERISNILYIPQNYLHQLSEPDGKNTRHELVKVIISLLRENPDSNKAYEQFKARKDHLNTIIENLVNDFFDQHKVVTEKTEKKARTGDKKAIQEYIDKLSERTTELKKSSGLSPEETKKYDKFSNELTSADEDLSHFLGESEDLFLSTDKAIRELDHVSKNLSNRKNGLTNQVLKDQLSISSDGLDKILRAIRKLNTSLDRSGTDHIEEPNDHDPIAKEEKKLRAKITQLQEKLNPYLQGKKNETELTQLDDKIKVEREKLINISRFESEIKTSEAEIKKIRDKIFQEYNNSIDEYELIVEKLNKRGDTFDDKMLRLDGTFKFYHTAFKSEIKNYVNNNSFSAETWSKFYCFNQKNDSEFNREKHIESLKEFFDKIIQGDVPLKSSATAKSAIKSLVKEKFFDHWKVYYKDDEIAKMSAGKAGLVLLKLIVELSESPYPILIDQPEDNLDNRSITNELVEYLRLKKVYRQIIIVTHNANIVVNADAENIIVANQSGQEEDRDNKDFQFDYVNDGLESSFKKTKKKEPNLLHRMGIKEHATEILEGGETAFLKREEKYGFK